jgi:formylmethanofuran dehydrogenase subunit E
MTLRAQLLAILVGGVAACNSLAGHDTHAPESSSASPQIDAVIAVHGGAGPWAVAGYRMGEYAMKRLGLQRGSFDLEVTHFSPHEVQYSCIADGAAAATGASLGKLNLTLAAASPAETRTLYRRKSTGRVLELRLTDSFETRYLNVPRDRLAGAGREVLGLREQDIFEQVR